MQFYSKTINVTIWSNTGHNIEEFKIGEIAKIEFCSHNELWKDKSPCTRVSNRTPFQY